MATLSSQGISLREIERRLAEDGHVARKDSIRLHLKNHDSGGGDDEIEVRALALALRKVLPGVPDVAVALAQSVEQEGARDLASAIRELIPQTAPGAGCSWPVHRPQVLTDETEPT